MKKPPARDIMVSAASSGTYDGIARVALEISKRQATDLRRIKEALVAGDKDTALERMSEFLGLRDGSANHETTKQ